MIFLSDADVVLPDRVLGPATVVIDGDRIIDVRSDAPARSSSDLHFDLRHHTIVPGFIDVHVHGVEGTDVLEESAAIARVASRLPRFGVTAFCPTSIACSPPSLRSMLAAVRDARLRPPSNAARVLPAHLESNFINPDFRGAQPLECLRLPFDSTKQEGDFTGADILREIEEARPDVGIITVAPEIAGADNLIRDLSAHGHLVSLGHSGATYEEGLEGIRLGARHATHLFNRMPPVSHRAPGLAGAVLAHEEVSTEIICDGVHVHPSMVRVAIAAKGPSRIMAITDGTAGAGLPRGSRSTLGGRSITVREAAFLDDGTLAGSVLTMDRAFGQLTSVMGLSLVDAVTLCSTTPARALGLQGFGVIAPGAAADLVVLSRDLTVVQTWIGGELAYGR
ncbi:MAG TPA: N-acetylglucosamine-6-phosphate deacetylase [Vicinamibacterales bacterium]|jgi:N-acetylglucosamine-6-phosphate deacetylase